MVMTNYAYLTYLTAILVMYIMMLPVEKVISKKLFPMANERLFLTKPSG
jgi:hypothetical protein